MIEHVEQVDADTVRIEALRNRETRTFEVTIAKRDDTALAARSTGETRTEDDLGLQVTDLAAGESRTVATGGAR